MTAIPLHKRILVLRRPRTVEVVAEVIPESDAEFGGGTHQSEECVAVAGTARAVAGHAFGNMEADVTFGAIGMERYPFTSPECDAT